VRGAAPTRGLFCFLRFADALRLARGLLFPDRSARRARAEDEKDEKDEKEPT
jgi:hypothetical protein